MARYIDVDKLIEEMKKEDALVEYDEIEEYAEENTEDVAPVAYGKWLPQILNKSGLTNIFLCSRCYKFSCTANHHVKCIYTYCPHCGANMEE